MFLDIRGLVKSFGSEPVLAGVSLGVAAHQTLSILGRSGSGKTTLLKIVAGLEEADRGEVWLDGRPLQGVPPQERGVVYLYQEPLLFPHLDVWENIAFGLRLRNVAESEIVRRVGGMIDSVELRAGHLRLFAGLQDFAADPEIGVQDEIRFWTALAGKTGTVEGDDD